MGGCRRMIGTKKAMQHNVGFSLPNRYATHVNVAAGDVPYYPS